MTDLFGEAYSGSILHVEMNVDSVLGQLFPEVDRQSVYRNLDAYLYKTPLKKHPKDWKAFLVKCFKREKSFTVRNAGLAAELMAGSGPELPKGARMVRRASHSRIPPKEVASQANGSFEQKGSGGRKPMTREELAEAIREARSKLG